jgi:hypothetical protein
MRLSTALDTGVGKDMGSGSAFRKATRKGNKPRCTASLGLNGNTTSTIYGGYAVDERPLKRPAGADSIKLGCHCEARLARRSNLDRSSTQRPEIASLALAMTIWVSDAT